MQLNKVLKGLMIALPVMAIAACSSNKNASNDGSEGMLGAGTGMDANGGNGNMSSEEQGSSANATAAAEQHRLLRSGQVRYPF
ncbi:hypothetical protein VEE68_03340 [Escherichia coli]|nr:hypothetical protein VEE68_03340 [Escherichia coli]